MHHKQRISLAAVMADAMAWIALFVVVGYSDNKTTRTCGDTIYKQDPYKYYYMLAGRARRSSLHQGQVLSPRQPCDLSNLHLNFS